MLEPTQSLEDDIDDLDDYLKVLANDLKAAKCQFQIEHMREDIDHALDQRLETARRIRLAQRLTLTKHPLFG
jgi:hypothetical protein